MGNKYYDFFKRIDRCYPNKLINNLKKQKELYSEAKLIIKYEDTTLKNFFEKNGYNYIYKDINEIRKELIEELNNYTNNKKLNNLHLINNSLYHKVLRYATLENKTIDEYMLLLGFVYNTKEDEKRVKKVKEDLETLYPNKFVNKLSIIDNKLYSRVYKLAKKENMTVSQYIRLIGFNN